MLLSSHLLFSRHPVQKSNFDACAVTGYCSLKNTELADVCPASSTMQIDLLIVSDYIWDFFDGKSVWGEDSGQGGPVAVSTKVR